MAKKQEVYIFYVNTSDYEKLRDFAIDGHTMPSSYTKWSENNEALIESSSITGERAVKVQVNMVNFMKWCEKNSRNGNSKDRQEYAGLVYANLE